MATNGTCTSMRGGTYMDGSGRTVVRGTQILVPKGNSTDTPSVGSIDSPTHGLTLQAGVFRVLQYGSYTLQVINGGAGVVGSPWSIGLRSNDPVAIADMTRLYTKDVAASAELFAIDEAGVVTQLT